MFFDAETPDAPIPDALDLVVEVADMMAVFAAQQFERVDRMRREAMADAAAHGRELTSVIERGVRLELAVVEGLGPIPLDRARELCGGATGWMRVLAHPETGAVLSVGREQYRPPASLARLVKWRADRCMAPGCGIPASRCDTDHSLAWEHGGDTSSANLAPLCRGHHMVKHHGGWLVEQIADSGGAIRWASPMGREYVVRPERRVRVFRPSSTEDAPF